METLNAAALVAKVRSQSGLTQADLAARAGTSQAAVARYETGASTPSIDCNSYSAFARGWF
jgi:hypothetical protein